MPGGLERKLNNLMPGVLEGGLVLDFVIRVCAYASNIYLVTAV
jgi:hypothetical protein